MPNQPKQERRNKGGAPLGNRNASKPETAKRVTIRLYDEERQLVQLIAQALKISQNEAHREAIKMLAKALGLGAGS